MIHPQQVPKVLNTAYSDLKIEENTKENYNRVFECHKNILFSSNFWGQENINFQTLSAN